MGVGADVVSDNLRIFRENYVHVNSVAEGAGRVVMRQTINRRSESRKAVCDHDATLNKKSCSTVPLVDEEQEGLISCTKESNGRAVDNPLLSRDSSFTIGRVSNGRPSADTGSLRCEGGVVGRRCRGCFLIVDRVELPSQLSSSNHPPVALHNVKPSGPGAEVEEERRTQGREEGVGRRLSYSVSSPCGSV